MADKSKPQRRNPRLDKYDYSTAGGYFITICTYNKACTFGQIVDNNVILNRNGLIAHSKWLDIPNHHAFIELDEFIIMPNHVHGIILIMRARQASPLQPVCAGSSQPASLGVIIGSYKASVARQVNHLGESQGAPVWQRNYYEHVIRRDESLDKIRRYIRHNPFTWHRDPENPGKTS